MMRRLVVVVVVTVLGLPSCERVARRTEGSDDAPVSATSRLTTVDGRVVVLLDSAARRQLDLDVARLAARDTRAELALGGVVVPDLSRRSVVRAPVAGSLGLPEGVQWPSIGSTVRRGQELGQVSDTRPLVAAMDGVVTRLGARPGEMVGAGQELLEITDFASPLVRVAWSAEAPSRPPPRIVVERLDGLGPRADALLEGPAPEVDSYTRRAAWLYRVRRGWTEARPGLPVVAHVPVGRAPDRRTFVPDAAVVQWDGLVWVFRERAPGEFERTRLVNAETTPGGWLVRPDGAPAAGDAVVIRGAQVLLSEEFKSRVRVGDEVGE